MRIKHNIHRRRTHYALFWPHLMLLFFQMVKDGLQSNLQNIMWNNIGWLFRSACWTCGLRNLLLAFLLVSCTHLTLCSIRVYVGLRWVFSPVSTREQWTEKQFDRKWSTAADTNWPCIITGAQNRLLSENWCILLIRKRGMNSSCLCGLVANGLILVQWSWTTDFHWTSRGELWDMWLHVESRPSPFLPFTLNTIYTPTQIFCPAIL